MTRLFRLPEGLPLPEGVAASLRAGALAIFPTDTLYGMAVDPSSPEGLAHLFRVKGREEGKPVPLLLADAGSAARWAAEASGTARRLMGRFWPGALTLVLPASPAVPDAVSGGSGTVGLRVPAHPLARALAAAAGGAVTGTSANRSGQPCDWPDADALRAEFGGEADWLFWDGPVPRGAEPSTVVRLDGDSLSCLREGAIPFRTITEYLQGRE